MADCHREGDPPDPSPRLLTALASASPSVEEDLVEEQISQSSVAAPVVIPLLKR
jgi:hypothetical protein